MNCADMEGERRRSRSGKIQGHYTSSVTSCHEGAGEDSGWEVKKVGIFRSEKSSNGLERVLERQIGYLY